MGHVGMAIGVTVVHAQYDLADGGRVSVDTLSHTNPRSIKTTLVVAPVAAAVFPLTRRARALEKPLEDELAVLPACRPGKGSAIRRWRSVRVRRRGGW